MPNNGGLPKQPPDDFYFTVSVEIRNDNLGGDSTDQYGEIRTLDKRASGHGPNSTVSNGPIYNLVVFPNVGGNKGNFHFP